MRWLMDLRGEKDVIGWSSLPAVERDGAQHLQHRATERKRRRPSAGKSLFHHRRLSTAENFSCRGEIMITARSTGRLFIAGEHLLPRQNMGIHPSIPLQHTLFGKALHSSGWVLPEKYILHLPCQLTFHFFPPNMILWSLWNFVKLYFCSYTHNTTSCSHHALNSVAANKTGMPLNIISYRRGEWYVISHIRQKNVDLGSVILITLILRLVMMLGRVKWNGDKGSWLKFSLRKLGRNM